MHIKLSNKATYTTTSTYGAHSLFDFTTPSLSLIGPDFNKVNLHLNLPLTSSDDKSTPVTTRCTFFIVSTLKWTAL